MAKSCIGSDTASNQYSTQISFKGQLGSICLFSEQLTNERIAKLFDIGDDSEQIRSITSDSVVFIYYPRVSTWEPSTTYNLIDGFHRHLARTFSLTWRIICTLLNWAHCKQFWRRLWKTRCTALVASRHSFCCSTMRSMRLHDQQCLHRRSCWLNQPSHRYIHNCWRCCSHWSPPC